jgi:hypothetical protein
MHQIVDAPIVRIWRNADDLGRVMQLGAKLTPAERRDKVCDSAQTSRDGFSPRIHSDRISIH